MTTKDTARKRKDGQGATGSEKGAEGIKGLSIRLDKTRWKQLRNLATERETSMHELILQGIDHVLASAK
jgi:predicted DNA-binding ribbon-helix-helix protein